MPDPTPAQVVLAEYRAKHGRGALARLAQRAGMPAPRLSELAHGRVRAPSPKNAIRIAAASGGEITAAALLGVDTDPTVATDSADASPAHADRGAA
jgi:DNA-binding transcriptional regulator YdaS (Cro superfamily)